MSTPLVNTGQSTLYKPHPLHRTTGTPPRPPYPHLCLGFTAHIQLLNPQADLASDLLTNAAVDLQASSKQHEHRGVKIYITYVDLPSDRHNAARSSWCTRIAGWEGAGQLAAQAQAQGGTAQLTASAKAMMTHRIATRASDAAELAARLNDVDRLLLCVVGSNRVFGLGQPEAPGLQQQADRKAYLGMSSIRSIPPCDELNCDAWDAPPNCERQGAGVSGRVGSRTVAMAAGLMLPTSNSGQAQRGFFGNCDGVCCVGGSQQLRGQTRSSSRVALRKSRARVGARAAPWTSPAGLITAASGCQFVQELGSGQTDNRKGLNPSRLRPPGKMSAQQTARGRQRDFKVSA